MGSTSFWKKKAPIAMAVITIISGLIMRKRDIPAAFIAVSSNFSPRLPKVMRLARSTARGKAIGTIVSAA